MHGPRAGLAFAGRFGDPRRIMRIVAGMLLLWLAGAADAAAIAGRLRIVQRSDGADVRLALSAPLPRPPRALALDNPMRWAVDLGGAAAERREAAGGGAVRAARVSQFDPATVRIVVDLDRPLALVAARQNGDQVLELQFRNSDPAAFGRAVRSGRAPVAGFVQERPVAVPPGPAPAPDLAGDHGARLDEVEAVLEQAERQVAPAVAPPAVAAEERPAGAGARPAPAGRRLIVIDAGHGGKDPGAPAINGRREKDITLAIAKAARRAVARRGYTVRLTRDDDRFLTLGERVRLARGWGADLFISIHADSAGNGAARGASVYTLSDVASDREAARLAAKENRADLIAGVDLSRESRDVTRLLIDLAQRDSMNASADFAQALQQALGPRGIQFRSRFHQFAGFAVLKNLGVPAVLLETGYLSNTADAGFLGSNRGQNAIGEGIADAVARYFTPGR